MRFHELYDGIEVIDEQNKPIGVSKVAAKKVNIISKRFSKCSIYSNDEFLGFNWNGNDTSVSACTNFVLSTGDYVSIWKVNLFLHD